MSVPSLPCVILGVFNEDILQQTDSRMLALCLAMDTHS